MLKSFLYCDKIEAGCDEVGRGCLAGPLVAASVIFSKDYTHEWLTDSKKISPKKRNILKEEILKGAISWGIGLVSVEEIDQRNILQSSFLGMLRAVENMKIQPQFLLIDGNRFTLDSPYPYQCVIKGDQKYLSIAAASILAKVYRDALMGGLSKKHPQYGWETNMGYPTAQHRKMIKKTGVTPYHRKNFKLF